MDLKRISKFMSLVLRHQPEKAGLKLDKQGWVLVDDLIKGMNDNGFDVSPSDIQEVVAENNKKRFAYSDDGTKIRASQGHSVKVDLELKKQRPPRYLYHGTKDQFLESIWKTGLEKRNRHAVHLSDKVDTAENVASRRKGSVILVIDAGAMNTDGYDFYQSANGVWLTDGVPVKYIEVLR